MSEQEMNELRATVLKAVAEAFSGDEYQENAEDAASEHEWSWFKWLAQQAVRSAFEDVAR